MEKQQDAAPRKLIVSKTNTTGQAVRIGSLTFDESNRGTLATEGSGPAVEALKSAWQEIQKEPKLYWTQSVPGEFRGEKVMMNMDVEVPRDDPRYVYAVLDTLERKYAFRVDFERR
jgi:hypothetical protein